MRRRRPTRCALPEGEADGLVRLCHLVLSRSS